MDDSKFEFVPREGLGVAVDLGTTTLVVQLLDLRTANVLAVRTGLNLQARHGADMTLAEARTAGRTVAARSWTVWIATHGNTRPATPDRLPGRRE
ncbi:MAG: hypothetical protein HY360_16390 [Verrucomicrobia bacterium]|nr:hypothetical protein [Verrucomicrobiota bacterium]